MWEGRVESQLVTKDLWALAGCWLRGGGAVSYQS